MTHSSFSHSSKRMTDDPLKVKEFSRQWMLFQTDFTLSNKMAGPKVWLWRTPCATFPETNLSLLPLSPKYTKRTLLLGGFTFSQGSPASFVCSWNILWLSFSFAGIFLVSHYCWALALFLINVGAPQGISFSLSLNEQMLSLNEIWKYMAFLTKS